MLAKFGKHATARHNISYVVDAADVRGVSTAAFVACNHPLFCNKELKILCHRRNRLQFINVVRFRLVNSCAIGSIVDYTEAKMPRVRAIRELDILCAGSIFKVFAV